MAQQPVAQKGKKRPRHDDNKSKKRPRADDEKEAPNSSVDDINKCDVTILTWNSQGDKSTSDGQPHSFIRQNKPDIVLQQECGKPAFINTKRGFETKELNSKQMRGTQSYGVYNFGTDKAPLKYFIHHFSKIPPETIKQNTRVSLLCMVKAPDQTLSDKDIHKVIEPILVPPPNRNLRPWVGCELKWDFKINGNSVQAVYSAHAPSVDDAIAAGIIDGVMQNIPNQQKAWMVFGDFNCNPRILKDNQHWNDSNTAGLLNHGHATHDAAKRGDKLVNQYDYGFASFVCGDWKVNIGSLASDHESVFYGFKK